jgi:glycine dehydrogenase subunit 2
VREDLAKFLPGPRVRRVEEDGEERYELFQPEASIGRVHAFHGNFGMFVRAYTYIRMHGAEGLRQVSEDAVLNANYIRAGLRDLYDLPFGDRTCMHETVFSAVRQKAQGVRALDVAKRMLDFGIHPPTVYFPLVVPEALMIEPTETESKESLDHFIAVMRQIAQEAAETPEVVQEAPHTTEYKRLDEVAANRALNLRWRPEERAAVEAKTPATVAAD